MAQSGPGPMILFPDGVLTGRANIVSVTSEATPFPGSAEADTDNVGDLEPQFEAVSISADYALDMRLLRAGGAYSGAEWVWKDQADADTRWRGVDEVRYPHTPHDPFFQASNESHPSPTLTSEIAAVYARRIGSIFLYLIGPSLTTVYVRHRTIGASDPTAWTLVTFNLTGDPLKTGQAGGIEVLEMSDGSLRMLVLTGTNGTADNDVDVYASADGTTWTLAVRRAWSIGYGARENIIRIRAAVSGDWIRMVGVNSGGTTRTLVSSDTCATFTWLSGSNLTGTAGPADNGRVVDPRGSLDIEGVGDAAGSFILCYRNSVSATVIRLRTASRDADWSDASNVLSTTTGNILRACLVNDGARMYVFAVTDGGVGNTTDVEGTFLPLDVPLTDALSNNHFSRWRGYARYEPAYLSGCRADPGLLLVWGLADPDNGPGNAIGSSSGLMYIRGWTQRSLWKNEYEWDPSGLGTAFTVCDLRWDSLLGQPNRVGLQTPVVPFSGASGSATWFSDFLRLQSTAAGAGGRYYLAYNEGAVPATKWLDGPAYFGWTVGNLVNGDTSDDRISVRITAFRTGAGATLDFSVRHGNGTLVLYDNNAGGAALTLTAGLTTTFWDVRVGLGQSGPTWQAGVAMVRSDGRTATWTTGTASLSWEGANAAAVTFQGYEWGHRLGGAATSSHWRRIEHEPGSACNQYSYTNPTNTRGAPTTGRPWYVTSGLYSFWSGGAGFEGDRWQVENRHTYEVENLFVASPQVQWRGTSTTTQTIVMTADPDGSREVFQHDALALFGTSAFQAIAEYNTTDSWGSPAFSETFDATILDDLRISAIGPADVTVNGLYDDHLYVGKYLRYWTGGKANPSLVMAFAIERQVGSRLFLTTSFDLTTQITAGASAAIYDDKLVHGYASRVAYPFMRLRLGIGPLATGAAMTVHPTGDIRGGALVAGLTLGFPAELAWQHPEQELPNVELTDGFQGVRWGVKTADARRRIEAKVIGDVDRNRQILTSYLRHLSQFSARLLAFAWDRATMQQSTMPARFIGTIEREEVGWRQAADGTWYTVGNLALIFEEEL